MRYETPEILVLGRADEVVLGDTIDPSPEGPTSSPNRELVGYDE